MATPPVTFSSSAYLLHQYPDIQEPPKRGSWSHSVSELWYRAETYQCDAIAYDLPKARPSSPDPILKVRSAIKRILLSEEFARDPIQCLEAKMAKRNPLQKDPVLDFFIENEALYRSFSRASL